MCSTLYLDSSIILKMSSLPFSLSTKLQLIQNRTLQLLQNWIFLAQAKTIWELLGKNEFQLDLVQSQHLV